MRKDKFERSSSKNEPHGLESLQKAIETHIVGQKNLIENLLVSLLADGHVLIEGMPGLAKTTAAKAIAKGIQADFHRIQFTPDLLPSDLIGTEIYVHEKSNFTFRKGPLFNNILLADEINRAPAKVQSSLLEAMEEKQITVGHKTYKLPDLYMVLATQNPIEQEGTYNLPEAQLDRFLMHIVVDYPTPEEERQIIDLMEKEQTSSFPSVTTQEEIISARKEACEIPMNNKLKDYVVSLVTATRMPAQYDEKLAQWIAYGASPRATLALIRCAKALAWLWGDAYVTPHHVQKMALPVLRHRIISSTEADIEGIERERIVKRLLEAVAIP
ncbi:MAG: MoxR family ATPase [Alphaproteobacteria bacterium]|nr:MoxR family ATPase [Alphaproteobacteria bacterium]